MTITDATTAAPDAPVGAAIDFEVQPSDYRHWSLTVDGDIATLSMAVEPFGGLGGKDYELKLNSYDLRVDIELADAIQRLRFEHPAVRAVVVTGALDRVFCAGANIVMLRSSAHAFKVNFCKYTNETRLGIEDASENSNLKFLAALNGTASGGGYELALACDRILLVDDRNSAVSFPEVPLLGVLPGTGGLTRITDKRKIRRDRCDVFSSVAEGIKGKRAVEWDLVDRVAPLSKWEETVAEEARALADQCEDRADATGVPLPKLTVEVDGHDRRYEYVELKIQEEDRTATLTINAPDSCPATEADAFAAGASWWLLQAFRELDDALLHLRMNLRDVALVLIRATGSAETMRSTDELIAGAEHWFARETRQFVKRVLKRLDVSAKSFYAIADGGTNFTGTFLEMALASDRIYLLDDPDTEVEVGITVANAGMFPMSNGISRLETRFLGDPERVPAVLAEMRQIPADEANELGLATFAPDDIDWEDELRLAIEERASFSPDALTGMEANLRFAGPETMETKIFGRLTAWQNWIFQRPNAVGDRGALSCYGTPMRPEFNVERT
ncbi:MAG: 2,3-epoxybenzoyl-CoA dihydrolase [Planctomycetota bacterium]|nr:2,3-epoxybenzoyl-CoA dihydrolase [Planctomycetota bacterium]MDG1985820.1 2,3-epoxybenzoyl-CoA dihydrolase [Planctomycetota bacterium]